MYSESPTVDSNSNAFSLRIQLFSENFVQFFRFFRLIFNPKQILNSLCVRLETKVGLIARFLEFCNIWSICLEIEANCESWGYWVEELRHWECNRGLRLFSKFPLWLMQNLKIIFKWIPFLNLAVYSEHRNNAFNVMVIWNLCTLFPSRMFLKF